MSLSNKNKDPLKFSKKIIVFCLIFISLYTIVQVFLSYILTIELSPTLTTCVYAFFGTELAACAVIRIFDKEDKKEKDSSDEDSEESDPQESEESEIILG